MPPLRDGTTRMKTGASRSKLHESLAREVDAILEPFEPVWELGPGRGLLEQRSGASAAEVESP